MEVLAIPNSKHYSTLSRQEVLDPTQFDQWPKEEVYALLRAEKTKGGAGLTDEKVQPLISAGFDGSSIAVIANNIIEEGKKQAKIELLANRDYQHISQTTLEIIVNWVSNMINNLPNSTGLRTLSQLRSLFNCGDKPISNIPSKNLVQTFGKDFEMRNVEQEVTIFSESIETLIKTLTETNNIDKQMFQIFFIASAPGTGKSRLNQELRGLSIKYLYEKSTLTDQQKQYLINSIHITTSFKGGTSFSPQIEKSPYDILTYRLLYSYFSRNDSNVHTFQDFISQKKFPITLNDAISIIRKDREQSEALKEGEPLIIYFSIDEFQDLLISANFLDKQVKELCSAMYSSWEFQKVIFVPIYSGLSWNEMHRVLKESTTGYRDLPRSPIDMVGIEKIAESVFEKHGIPKNQLYENGMVYSYLKKTYGHPRSLEKTLAFLVQTFSKNQPYWSLTEDDRHNLESQLQVFNPVSVKLAKQILAHTITGKPIRYDKEFGKTMAKELDDKGVFKLDHVVGEYPRIVLSWYQLKGLATKLYQTEPIWAQFLESLEECLHNPNIKLFEKFQILFDLILNRSFIYLGYSEMTLNERFRGFGYCREEKEFFENTKINLKSFPDTYIPCKTAPDSILPQGDESFLDYDTTSTNTVSILLGYQQKCTKDLKCCVLDATPQYSCINSSLKNVELIPSVVDEKYKSNNTVLLGLNHKLTDKTCIPKQFMLCTRTVRNHNNKGNHLEETDLNDFRTDMEIYFGTYIYNLVFSYLPKRIHFNQLDSQMVSRLFGVSERSLGKSIFDKDFNNLNEFLGYLNTHFKQKEEIRLLYNVKIVFTKD